MSVVLKAHLKLHHRGCVSESLAGAASMAQISGDRGSDVWVLRAETPEEVDRLLALCEKYADNRAEVLAREPTAVVFRGRNTTGGTVATIQSSGCSILWPILYMDGREFFTIVAPSRAALNDLLARLGALGSAELLRVSDVLADAMDATVSVGDFTSGMTAKQLEVLRSAIDRGYYDSPRRTSTEALADSFGVARTTVEEHLRKAEREVLARFAELVRAQPVLARAAARGTGRPRKR